MTVIRRCDRKGCDYEAADIALGVSQYFVSFELEGHNVDLCPRCISTIRDWLKGEITLGLPERTPA